MNTALMRFQDYTWKHNPKTIQVACRREIKEWKLPGQGNLLQDLGPGKRIVPGEGLSLIHIWLCASAFSASPKGGWRASRCQAAGEKEDE